MAPIFLFLVVPRFPRKGIGPRERFSVIFTDLAVLALFGVMSAAIGWRAYLLIQLPLGQDTTPALQRIRPLTLRASLRSIYLNLWDEANQRLVSFAALRALPR